MDRIVMKRYYQCVGELEKEEKSRVLNVIVKWIIQISLFVILVLLLIVGAFSDREIILLMSALAAVAYMVSVWVYEEKEFKKPILTPEEKEARMNVLMEILKQYNIRSVEKIVVLQEKYQKEIAKHEEIKKMTRKVLLNTYVILGSGVTLLINNKENLQFVFEEILVVASNGLSCMLVISAVVLATQMMNPKYRRYKKMNEEIEDMLLIQDKLNLNLADKSINEFVEKEKNIQSR